MTISDSVDEAPCSPSPQLIEIVGSMQSGLGKALQRRKIESEKRTRDSVPCANIEPPDVFIQNGTEFSGQSVHKGKVLNTYARSNRVVTEEDWVCPAYSTV